MTKADLFANANITDGCWVWLRQKNRWGYGRVKYKGKVRQAHRVAWEMVNGTIPVGLQLDHLCKTRACIRPSHLEPVTPRENVLRSDGVASKNARKTICKNGHPFSPENTYQQPKGRGCRRCAAIASLKSYHKNKEN